MNLEHGKSQFFQGASPEPLLTGCSIIEGQMTVPV